MKTQTSGISFKTSREDHDLIDAIANRASDEAQRGGVDYDKMLATMDLTACHCNGCPLDLAALRDADVYTFGHDVFGIRRHINRQTGELGGCFLPRTALCESLP